MAAVPRSKQPDAVAGAAARRADGVDDVVLLIASVDEELAREKTLDRSGSLSVCRYRSASDPDGDQHQDEHPLEPADARLSRSDEGINARPAHDASVLRPSGRQVSRSQAETSHLLDAFF